MTILDAKTEEQAIPNSIDWRERAAIAYQDDDDEGEKEYIVKHYEKWGRLPTLNKFDELTSQQLNKILKEAGKL